MANINKIRLSGTTYSIQDLNATKTVELTQAEYDALSVKDPNTFYIITDATAGDLSNYYTKTETDGLLDTKLDATAYTPTDLSNYYTKSETSGATEISTALELKADTATTYTKTETDNAITAATSTKQDTLVSGTNIKTINNQSILGEGNIEIQGGSGGGKAISAGTNISITTGETADTINCTLPIETINNAYGISQIYVGDNIYKNNNYQAIVLASKDDSSTGETIVEFAHGAISIGSSNKVYQNGIVIGKNSTAGASNSWGHIAIGYNTVATGTTKTNINNQIKVDANNQVYIYNKDNTEMICLQDQLGGGGSSYTAGDGIDITNDVISVTGKVDTSAITTSVTSSSTDSQVPSAKAVYDALQEGGGGGSITIDPSLDSGSTNPVANSAITNTIYNETARFDGAASNGYLVRISSSENGNAIGINGMKIKTLENIISQTSSGIWLYTSTINGKKAVSTSSSSNTKDFSLVETSAITTSVTSSSTDSQVPSAKAVNDKLGGLSLVKLSQNEYDSLTTKDSQTLYVVTNS